MEPLGFRDFKQNRRDGEDIEQVDPKDGCRPLHAAVITEQEEAVAYLLRKLGFELREVSLTITQLQITTNTRIVLESMFACLFAALDFKLASNNSPRQNADLEAPGPDGLSPLLLACRCNAVPIVQLLLEKGADRTGAVEIFVHTEVPSTILDFYFEPLDHRHCFPFSP